MRTLPLLLTALLIGAFAWSVLPTGSVAATPSLQSTVASLPVFLQQGSRRAVATPPPNSGATPVGALGTSVIPPGPNPGEQCSTEDSGGGQVCSAMQNNERCSAFNDQGNRCSAFADVSAHSSLLRGHRLRRMFGVTDSTAPGPIPLRAAQRARVGAAHCSALGSSRRMLCSTKGAGLSQCTVISGTGEHRCSVENFGWTNRAFCSTKFNQPTIAKACSSFIPAGVDSACSIVAGGKGVCTTFGAADPGSCSAFVTGAHCSVIGGAPGPGPCTQ